MLVTAHSTKNMVS